jgi:hypothetical protein
MDKNINETQEQRTIHSVVCSYCHVASGLSIGKKYDVVMQSKEGEKDVVLIKNDYGDLKIYSLNYYFS